MMFSRAQTWYGAVKQSKVKHRQSIVMLDTGKVQWCLVI
jgi:hypothetical protein